jgi:hypothetical protein
MKRRNTVFAAIFFVLTISFADAQRVEEGSQKEIIDYRKTLWTLLPKSKEIAGLKFTSGPDFFEPQNLWEYINGEAVLYFDYGFELLATAEYMKLDASTSMSVEIYQMQSPIHAFGIYAAERSPKDIIIKIGVQGYLNQNILNFWKGPYYIKLSSFQTSPETKEILMKTAAFIDNKIKGSFSEPELFTCFPENNRVNLSERFIPKNFLGLSFLKGGYRVEYAIEGNRWQVFLVNNASHDIAKEVFRRYEDFLKTQHEIISHSTKCDYQLIFTKTEQVEAIFQYGPFVGGVLNGADLSEAERSIEQIVQNLKRGCS